MSGGKRRISDKETSGQGPLRLPIIFGYKEPIREFNLNKGCIFTTGVFNKYCPRQIDWAKFVHHCDINRTTDGSQEFDVGNIVKFHAQSAKAIDEKAKKALWRVTMNVVMERDRDDITGWQRYMVNGKTYHEGGCWYNLQCGCETCSRSVKPTTAKGVHQVHLAHAK